MMARTSCRLALSGTSCTFSGSSANARARTLAPAPACRRSSRLWPQSNAAPVTCAAARPDVASLTAPQNKLCGQSVNRRQQTIEPSGANPVVCPSPTAKEHRLPAFPNPSNPRNQDPKSESEPDHSPARILLRPTSRTFRSHSEPIPEQRKPRQSGLFLSRLRPHGERPGDCSPRRQTPLHPSQASNSPTNPRPRAV